MTKDVPWDEAIQQVLRAAGTAMHYADIAEKISSQGLRKSVGATPAATVASYLSNSLSKTSSPYLRVGGGEYTLVVTVKNGTKPERVSGAEVPDAIEAGALRSFGMFWRRDFVTWSGAPKLLGRQQLGASEVNFADQTGVYLLHDRERVIYVGRAADTLYSRLKAHTTDRLGGRWDRFSWFGLREVSLNGGLSDRLIPWSQSVVIETMEALLIESLEPPLNRKRGDNFAGAEYLQIVDPDIEQARKEELLRELTRLAFDRRS